MKTFISKIKALTGDTAVFIGEGAYSKAYRSTTDDSIVYIVSEYGDNAKEALMLASRDTESYVHLPKMNSVGSFEYKNADYVIWKTEYSAEPINDAKKLALTLTTLWQNFKRANMQYIEKDTSNRPSLVANFIAELSANELIPATIIESLERLIMWLANFDTGFWLDMKLANFGMSANGTLLLRDVAFFINLDKKF